MKVGVGRVVWMLPVVLLAGCVQSYQPFYTEQSKVTVPELVGEWQPLKALDDFEGVTIKPWVCRQTGTGMYEVVACDTNGVAAKLEVVSFKARGQRYCDVTAGSADQEPWFNRYWAYSVCQVHTLWKLQFTNDLVTLTGMDSDWLQKAVENKEAELPFVAHDGKDERLYTATPQQWERFLTKHGTNTALFGGDPAYILKRRPAPPATSKKDSK